MSFQVHALPPEPFAHLFELDEDALSTHNARRVEVTSRPGFPCRVSLVDAEIGETVILLHYEHQTARTPYRASHALYVRQGVEQARPSRGEIPEALLLRPISLRAFDEAGNMIDADLASGAEVQSTIERLLQDPQVAYLHLHNAKPGCYAARVTRT